VSCCLTNLSGGEKFSLDTPTADDTIVMTTRCSTLATNGIDVFYLSAPVVGNFNGVVECSQGGADKTQSSSSMTGTTQDGDGDGIPNANDNCPNLPHARCYKEGDTAMVAHSNR
jgi:hypothetical protein